MHPKTRSSWDTNLIRKYDYPGPRYTSYPTAVQFSDTFDIKNCLSELSQTLSNNPLSLYVHIPFCAKLCYYCGCNKIITNRKDGAAEYLTRLHKEIEQQSQYVDNQRIIQQMHWGGGTPTFLGDDQIHRLMAKLKSIFKFKDDDSGDYAIEIDPRECSMEKLRLLRDEGFNRISLGVQDFNPAVQQAVNRVQSFDLVKKLVRNARNMAFKSINMDLIYGLPLQTLASFESTLEQVIELSPDRLSIFNYAHLPERFKAQRLIKTGDLPDASEKLAIQEQTIKTLTDKGYVHIGMDHFAKPDDPLTQAQQEGMLHRNFQGYSTHKDCDLLAFGVSAISQIGPYIFQNTPGLKQYKALLDAGETPVIRGIKLTSDDAIRRQAIMQLICHFKLDKREIETRFGLIFDQYFSRELNQLENFATDGLVMLSPGQIKVTDKGRTLIRSICMLFDAYLGERNEAQRYSRII